MNLHVARQRRLRIAGRRVVTQLGVVDVVIRHVETEAVDAHGEPVAGDVEDGGTDGFGAEIQVRLGREEVVQVVLPAARLPRPCGAAEPGLPVVGRRAIRFRVGPDIPVGLVVGSVLTGLLEPFMIRRRMRPHLVDDDFQTAIVRCLQQRFEVALGPKHRVDGAVVRDVVAKVAHGRFEERRQPDAIDAEGLHIVELGCDALEIANAVAVRIHERARVDLVEHRAPPPDFVPCSRHT